MTGLIPRSFIDELIHRVDLVELIDSHVTLKRQGSSFIACCPFHHEKNPSFHVIPAKQFYYCFGCGQSGNAISFIMAHLNQNFTDAVETLASRCGMSVPRDGKKVVEKNQANLYDLLLSVTQFYQQQLKNQGTTAIDYLKTRGVSGDMAKQYAIGYAPAGWQTLSTAFKNQIPLLITTGMLIPKAEGGHYDRFRNRVMFPIHDRSGRIVGFGARAIDPADQPKYLNSPETVIFQKGRELYGLHQAIASESTAPIVVVEGYMDVIALVQHGIPRVVATLGTSTSLAHIQRLSHHTSHIIFCFDGDAAGQKAAWRALENTLPVLDKNLDVRFAFLPMGDDPDSFIRREGKDGFEAYLTKAIPFNTFFFQTLTQSLDLSGIAGKSQLIALCKPHMTKMPEGPYKQLMLEEMTRLTHLSDRQIETAIGEKRVVQKPQHIPQVQRTPERIATALLLQHPEIYSQCTLPAEIVQHLQNNLIQQIIQILQTTPTANTAMLLEHWRDTPLFEEIKTLAAWPHQVPPEALAAEFSDTLRFLIKNQHAQKINTLLTKSRHEGLSTEERLTLQTLLKEKHIA